MGVKVENLDHLGIVAGIIDDLGIVEQIDAAVGTAAQSKVSPGQAVKAMILNGLGFVSAPLYLYGKFFEGKAAGHLLGEGITGEMLNDDLLGRVLDRLWRYGVSELFSVIAMRAFQVFGLAPVSYHLDSTSLSVQGQYRAKSEAAEEEPVEEQGEGREEPKPEVSPEGGEESEPAVIEITYGYSRDHRPDLKQFMMDVICSGDGGVPLMLNLGDGNQSDTAVFSQRIAAFRKQWSVEGLFVSDSALYSEENLQALRGLQWLTRVPLRLKAAQEAVSNLSIDAFQGSQTKGYRFATLCSDYGQVQQRWVVFESAVSRQQDLKLLDKQVKKAEAEANRQAKQLSQIEFACAEDAHQAGEQCGKTWRYHQVESVSVTEKAHYPKRGRPKPDEQPQRISHHVTITLTPDTVAVATAQRKAGRFILATNNLDEQALSADDLLKFYKQQLYSERGWRFLKDPLFFTSSVFLKTPRRIMALAMVMTLALMVYTLAERRLRQALHNTQQTVPDQKNKPTQTPTLRWIFQCFQSIHLLWLDEQKLISNLKSFHLQVLALLGPSCQKYYSLP